MAASPTSVPDTDRPVGVSRSRTYFPELESLRGIAILLVFFFHADGLLVTSHAEGAFPNPLLAWVRQGAAGVDLFFVLSGFLLSIPFLQAATGGRPVSVRRYFERRALRILPLYWLVVVMATLVKAQTPVQLLKGVPYLFFLNSFPGWSPHLFPHSIPWWSLATEVQFYVVLPLIGFLLCTRLRRRTAAVLFVVWTVALVAVLTNRVTVSTIEGKLKTINSVFGRGHTFLLGMLAAWIHMRWGPELRRRLHASAFWRRGGADLVVWLLVLAGGAVVGWVSYIGRIAAVQGLRPLWHEVVAACMTAILLLILLAPIRLRWLWVNPILGRIGVLSYSLFLIHIWPIDVALTALHGGHSQTPDGWTLASTATVFGVLLGCLGLSELTYRFVERPFLVRKARVAS